MKIRTYAMALALAAAPGLLAAQEPTPHQGHGEQHGIRQQRRGGLDRQHGPRQGGYQQLLRYRQQLGLTDAQVSRLQAIRQRMESQNAPIVQRIEAARRQAGLPEFRARRGERGERGEGMQGRRPRGEGRAQRGERPRLTDEQRQAMQRFREQVRPLHQEMMRNRQEALREAQAVLTPQQREQVQQLIREHRGERGERGRRGRQ
jgi:hypothetical protein